MNNFFRLIDDRPKPILVTIIAAYVVIHRILSPPLNAFIFIPEAELIILRGISNTLYQLTLFAPILFFRKVGILHPLAFAALFSAAFDIVFQPLHIPFPILSTFRQFMANSTSYSVYLAGIDRFEYAQIQIIFDLIRSAFLCSIYLGFFAWRSAENTEKSEGNLFIAPIIFSSCLYILLAILAGCIFIALRGGVEQQILSFYRGRYETLEGLGAFSAPVKTAVVAALLWFAVRPSTRPSIVFGGLVIALLPLYWLVDGSRSSVLIFVLSILLIYVLKSGRLPVKAGIFAGILAFTLFGLLGMLRQDYSAKAVDLSIFSGQGLMDAITASQIETNKRGEEEGDIAVIEASRHAGYLGGRSYLAVLAFPIPRVLWEEKPKNVFVYVNWNAFQGNPIAVTAPDTWGIPIEPATEAYWNFGILGVFGVGFVVGLFKKWVYNVFKRNSYSPWLAVVFVESLLYLNGGSRFAFYLIQNFGALFVIFAVARIVGDERLGIFGRRVGNRVVPLSNQSLA